MITGALGATTGLAFAGALVVTLATGVTAPSAPHATTPTTSAVTFHPPRPLVAVPRP
jgi:hypothetical protein